MSARKKKSSRRKKKRGRSGRSLSGLATAFAATRITGGELDRGQLGIGLLALAGSHIAGSILLGNKAIWPGAAALALGIARKNIYWTMAGVGMFLANGYQTLAPPQMSGTEDEMDGFDLSTFASLAKDRAKNYFSSFAEKLHLPKPADQSVNGMNGNEDVKYFLNPNSQVGQIDLSELDQLNAQVQSMNGSSVGEIDFSERNF